MRPDERQFLLTLLAEGELPNYRRHSPRRIARHLGMDTDRATCLCAKWATKDTYLTVGWLTTEGAEAARALLLEGIALKEPASRGGNEGKG